MQLKKRWNILSQTEKYTVVGIGATVLILITLGSSLLYSSGSSQDTAQKDTPPDSKEPQEETQDTPSSDKDQALTELPSDISPLSGKQCERHAHRPLGVMLAGDLEARPLSGINKAEIVVEMPVITGSVTRLMGLYICNTPEEVGSIRSARHDFISLVRGWDALFAHWGGSSQALQEINTGVRYTGEDLGPVDSINALNAGDVFFRKNEVPRPHNGFLSIPRALDYAKKQGYRLQDPDFEPYLFNRPEEIKQARKNAQSGTLYVGYAGVFSTKWDYLPQENQYQRYWANQKDQDRVTGEPVKADNVVVMTASSEQIEGQYNTVDIYGEGEATLYQNGEQIPATWKKDGFYGTLRFQDENGEELRLNPGQTFIQIIEPYQEARWELD